MTLLSGFNRGRHQTDLVDSGALGNVLKIRPPLVFTRQQADLFLDALGEVLQEMYGKS